MGDGGGPGGLCLPSDVKGREARVIPPPPYPLLSGTVSPDFCWGQGVDRSPSGG